jgi:hypothetical protein
VRQPASVFKDHQYSWNRKQIRWHGRKSGRGPPHPRTLREVRQRAARARRFG